MLYDQFQVPRIHVRANPVKQNLNTDEDRSPRRQLALQTANLLVCGYNLLRCTRIFLLEAFKTVEVCLELVLEPCILVLVYGEGYAVRSLHPKFA
jgi:hypothetical protein